MNLSYSIDYDAIRNRMDQRYCSPWHVGQLTGTESQVIKNFLAGKCRDLPLFMSICAALSTHPGEFIVEVKGNV
jgi:hypothetical protein